MLRAGQEGEDLMGKGRGELRPFAYPWAPPRQYGGGKRSYGPLPQWRSRATHDVVRHVPATRVAHDAAAEQQGGVGATGGVFGNGDGQAAARTAQPQQHHSSNSSPAHTTTTNTTTTITPTPAPMPPPTPHAEPHHEEPPREEPPCRGLPPRGWDLNFDNFLKGVKNIDDPSEHTCS